MSQSKSFLFFATIFTFYHINAEWSEYQRISMLKRFIQLVEPLASDTENNQSAEKSISDLSALGSSTYDTFMYKLSLELEWMFAINRGLLYAYWPAMLAKIKIIDAFKKSLEVVRAREFDEAGFKNLRERSKEILNLAKSTLSDLQQIIQSKAAKTI